MTEEIRIQAELVTEKPARQFPGIWISLGWIVLFFVLQIIAGGVAFIIAEMMKPHDAKMIDTKAAIAGMGGLPIIWSLVASSIVTIGLLWLYLRKKNRFAAIHLDRWSQLNLKTTLILAIALIGGALAFNYVYAEYIIPDVKLQDDLRKLFESIPKTAVNNILLFCAAAIFAPITEEILFRGFLQKSLSLRMSPILAIIIAGAVFAAIHMDAYAFPALFVMGSMFGYIYHRTGSLRVNILLHMLNNAAAVLFT
jgi:uncharacterized protein